MRQKAQQEAANIVKNAEKQIELETARALQQIRHEAVDLSVAIASKLLQRNVSKEDNERLIEDTFRQLDSTASQLDPLRMSPRRRQHVLSIAAALGGLLLFVWAARRAGVSEILDGIRRVGWGLLPLFALAGLRFCRARRSLAALRAAAIGGSVLRQAFTAFLAGDAIGNVTPLGLARQRADQGLPHPPSPRDRASRSRRSRSTT